VFTLLCRFPISSCGDPSSFFQQVCLCSGNVSILFMLSCMYQSAYIKYLYQHMYVYMYVYAYIRICVAKVIYDSRVILILIRVKIIKRKGWYKKH
jgi:hypothetical protein